MTPLEKLPKRLIVLLAAISAMGPAAMQILLPALPVIAETFQVSNDIAQLTLSLSMLAIALGSLFYGPLSDRYGRKPVMLLGVSITLTGSLLCYFAETISLLIAGRFIQAFGGASGLVLARAMVRDVYNARESARVIASLVMVMVVVPMISPALGGEIMHRFGWQTVFMVVAGFTAVIGLILAVSLPETLHSPVAFEGIRSMLAMFRRLLASRTFCGYAFCASFVSVVFFSFISAAPEIMVNVLERPATEYGYYFIMIPLGFIAGNYVTRRLGKRLEPDSLIRLGCIIGISGITLAIGLQLLGFHGPASLFAPVAFAVFGTGITLPNAQAEAINVLPEFAGSASGLAGFMQMSLSALAAQLVALIFNGTVYPLLLLMLLAASLSLLCRKLR